MPNVKPRRSAPKESSIESEVIRTFWTWWFPSLHVAKRMGTLLGAEMVYALVVAIILYEIAPPEWRAGMEWIAINALVLGTLLVFRNKEAYDRWWEGRKLWGQLINDIRNLAMKVKANVELSDQERQEFSRLLIAFPHALKCHLRDDADLQRVPGFEKEKETAVHLPQFIAGLIFNMLGRWNREGRLHETMWILDMHARALMDVCGGCERIHLSPVPYSYRVLLRHGVGLYLLLAPWLICLQSGFWGVLILAIVFYFLLGIELIAEDVEDPFGTDTDDLPLEKLCEKVKTSVVVILGEPAVQ